jgi:hypothetical protein
LPLFPVKVRSFLPVPKFPILSTPPLLHDELPKGMILSTRIMKYRKLPKGKEGFGSSRLRHKNESGDTELHRET